MWRASHQQQPGHGGHYQHYQGNIVLYSGHIVVIQSHSGHIVVIHKSHSGHIVVIYKSHSVHIVVIQKSHRGHIVVTLVVIQSFCGLFVLPNSDF